MRSLLPFLSVGVSFLSVFTLLPEFVTAKKDAPTIKSTEFSSYLEEVFYFDDSNVILGLETETQTVFRSDNAGESWDKIDDQGQAGKITLLWPHPSDNERAYMLTSGEKHWMTKDRGKTWKAFNSKSVSALSSSNTLKFHGRDPKKVIWNGIDFDSVFNHAIYYTDDDFSTVHSLGLGRIKCQWAVSTPLFAAEIDSEVRDRIYCITKGQYSSKSIDYKLVASDDYFKKQEVEPLLDNGRAVPGIISIAAVKKYFVAAAKSEGTDELALYVTDDSSQWHRAEFGQHKVAEGAYTVLESTNYSMQIDVLGSRPWNPMGHLFTSNSNGTYFIRNLDYTNRDLHGRVDFEKVQNIQGIVLVNIVDNPKEVAHSVKADAKKIVSQISFDDARTFEDLKVGRERLHLHSVTNAKQDGRVFSSLAPGIVMGVGNTGEYLRDFKDGDLYVSDDAGRTWRKALDGPYLYEFGNNGAILVAIDAKSPTKQLQYSLNHGKDWSKVDLDERVSAQFLTTVPDSTTRSFLMMGRVGRGAKSNHHLFKIDFDGLHERTCGRKDFEMWSARVDDDGKPTCIMGQQQSFLRRKADADCFIDADFKDPLPETKICDCTVEDYECDFNFERDPTDRKKCNPVGPLKVPEGECKKETDTFKGTSGWRLIPGNKCKVKGGEQLDKEIERPCKDSMKTPVSDRVEVEKTVFSTSGFREWHYLERGATSTDKVETIVMQDKTGKIWITNDHGQKWTQVLKGEKIVGIVPHPYFHERVFFLTESETVHYSINRGQTFHTFKARKRPSATVQPLRFHPTYKDYLLWSGIDGDGITVYHSNDRGEDWTAIARAAEKCDYAPREDHENLVFCEQYENEVKGSNLQLVSTDDLSSISFKVHFKNIKAFATMAEFIVVAAKSEDQKDLRMTASVDGLTFAEALFPKNFKVEHQRAYTVLDSSTHAVFLHVTVNDQRGREYGSILKSNSNGTSYVLAIGAVNRDQYGYVDFEKMQGLEGVAMVNVVSNFKEVDGGAAKKLKSKITHNDGAQWDLIAPPKKDASGHDYACVQTADKATEECSLHIHSYTERRDKLATFSSASAVGLMMAVGNVGEHLASKDSDETDTFITRDAGITWRTVKKGRYMWEYGDQGSVVVIVPEDKSTRSVFYSLDEGETWVEHEFSSESMVISEITTVPSDNSLKFLLWEKESNRNTIATVSLDFTQISKRQRECKLDENNPSSGDYKLWEPQHPHQENGCLFGHIAQYHRKKVEADCFNGKQVDRLPHNIVKNCTCGRSNYECDYNYEVISDGSCQLVEGEKPYDHEQYCYDHPEQREYYVANGYRKIPLDTCQGGKEWDKINTFPCPGYEEEYQRKHGVSGTAIFFAIVIPVAAAAGVGYWVWQRYQKYGFGSFGQIRLGESMGTSSSGSRGQSALIAIPVAIIAGIWAVAKAVPLLASSLFRSARGYLPVGSRTSYSSGPYRSRDAFSNRRQDYSSAAFVEDDELLGEDDELDAEEP